MVGASQYTIQLSGSTIYVAPLSAVPLRNVPVIAPALPLDQETIDPAAVAHATQTMLKRLDLDDGEQPVAVFVPWQGSATFQRLDAFCRGVVDGLSSVLKNGHPLVLAGDGDVGGLLGIHLHEEMKLANPVVSIDGLELKEFDYIDIGAMLEDSGAVPVVIKSLIFPGDATASEAARAVATRNQQHEAEHRNRTAGGAGGEADRNAAGQRPSPMPIACSTSVAGINPAPYQSAVPCAGSTTPCCSRGTVRRPISSTLSISVGRSANAIAAPSTITEAAIPASTHGNDYAAPADRRRLTAMTTGNVSGKSHNARRPSCDAQRPTATIASTWSRP